MNEMEQPATQPQPPPRRPWLRRGVISALVVGCLAVLGSIGWAAAYADPSPSPSTSPPNQPSDPAKPDKRERHLRGPGPGRALHGEFVVPKEGGGYQTIFVQQGQATEVSATSITVRSDDGYTRTYKINSSTRVTVNGGDISKLTTGTRVSVVATGTDQDRTATRVFDHTVRKRPHK